MLPYIATVAISDQMAKFLPGSWTDKQRDDAPNLHKKRGGIDHLVSRKWAFRGGNVQASFHWSVANGSEQTTYKSVWGGSGR